MFGPAILARTLSQTAVADKRGNEWQYHSRSDRHSKIACWGIIFDLLRHCPMLRAHAEARKVVFGVNHRMSDFKTNRSKNLDLVVSTPGSSEKRSAANLRSLIDRWSIVLDDRESRELSELPELQEGSVGSVHIAVEAKACMTAHIRAIPRLHDELNSSHLAIHGSSDYAIAGGFVMVNLSERFISPDLNRLDLSTHPAQLSEHRQPNDTTRVIDKIREIPRRSGPGEPGFDAMGILVVSMVNNGARVSVVEGPPAPSTGDIFHYDRFIQRMAHRYQAQFSRV